MPPDLLKRIHQYYDFAGGVTRTKKMLLPSLPKGEPRGARTRPFPSSPPPHRRAPQLISVPCPASPSGLSFELEVFLKRSIFVRVPFFQVTLTFTLALTLTLKLPIFVCVPPSSRAARRAM